MPSRNTIEKIRARKVKNNGSLRKLKQPPKWLFPYPQERMYLNTLDQFVKDMIELIRKNLIPQIPNLISDVNALVPNQEFNNDSKESRNDNWFNIFSGIILTISEALKKPEEEAIFSAENISNLIQVFNYNQFQKINRSVFGIDIFIDQPWLQDQLALFTSQNSQLIVSLKEEELSRVSGIVERGLQEGSRFETISEEIEKSFGITARRAKLIARDQTTKLNASLTKLRQQELGVTEYEWQTAQDERVRPSHKANNGKIFQWDNPPKETGNPGNDVNCRCVAIPILTGVLDI